MFSVQKILRPRHSRFFGLFAQVASNLSAMEQVFHLSVYERNLAVNKAYLRQVEELEHANDLTTHRLIIELGRNFITPFDRQDIHALATALDDIADYMYGIVKQRMSYGMAESPRETQQVAERLKTVIKLLVEILNDLNSKNLLKLSVIGKEIRLQLQHCDHLLDDAMNTLFMKRKDPIETLKLSDHFRFVQCLLDKCGEAVNVVDSIVIKYS